MIAQEVELLFGDSSQARKDLGWKPKYTLKEMIDSAWQAESRSGL